MVGIFLQLAGAMVTAFGLLAAYGRVRAWKERLTEWGRRHRARLRSWLHKGQDQVVTPTSAQAQSVMGTPDVRVDSAPDASLTVTERLARLEAYVQTLPQQFSSVNQRLVTLGRDIDASREAAKAAFESAVAGVSAQITDLRYELDDHQAVDLRVAGVGVLISAAGTLLGLWA
ncbi:hypothetical protein EV580_0107 [Mycobacterium sp. BK086]|nr:hypothetical protein EV580_0107 [Mycobacterium sp. BK086]